MIASLRGTLLEKGTASAVIEAGGVGYLVSMSTNSIADLPGVGAECFVYTVLSLRQDGISLFGFSTAEERALFERLVTVSGIGPKVALSALSTFPPESLMHAIASGDVKLVSTVPGLGKKTAQRIVLELKGTIEDSLMDTLPGMGGTGATLEAATQALLSMGFSPSEAEVALQGYDGSDDEEALRYALKRLGSKS